MADGSLKTELHYFHKVDLGSGERSLFFFSIKEVNDMFAVLSLMWAGLMDLGQYFRWERDI